MRVNEIIAEKINPDILDPRFTHTQEIGDYAYKAFAYEGRPGVKFLRIQAFADATDNPMDRIGDVLFRITDDATGGYLESINTFVADEYQKKGIASTMYAFAKMLGNDIQPSKDQLPAGQAMWKAWKKSGDAKHLTTEAVQGKLSKRQQQSTAGMNTYHDAERANSDYVAYRLGMAVASTDGKDIAPNMDRKSWIGKEKSTHPYTREEQEMLKKAYKAVGASYKDLNKGDMRSLELDSVNKVSTTPKKKPNKYGI